MAGVTERAFRVTNGLSIKERTRAAEITSAATHFLLRGRAATALAMLEQALVLDPEEPRALAGKTIALCQLGNAGAGIAFAERALEIHPFSGIILDARGFCYASLGDDARAVVDFEKAVALAPDDHNVYYNYACYCCSRGLDEKARTFLRLAFEKGPSLLPALAQRDPDLARYHRAPWFLAMTPSGSDLE